jgi:hypothetical protein
MLDRLAFAWTPRAESFPRYVVLLACFIRREGHAEVPASHVEDGVPLGRWVVKIRSRREDLSLQQVNRLDTMGFIWDPGVEVFEQKFAALLRFFEREGHTRVPQRHVEDGVRLGLWVARLRASREQLDENYVRQLATINFVWQPREDGFDRCLSVLKQFRAREGHSNVPQNHIEEGVKLGVWVSTLRSRRSQLSAERVSQLDHLSFVWSPFEQGFQRNLVLLSQFVTSMGHARVPTNYVVDGVRLGEWVRAVRSKRSTLPPDRIAQLDDLGFVWSVKPGKT